MNAAQLLLYGGGIRRRVQCINSTSLTVQPLGAVLATVGGVWKTYAHTTASVLNPTTLSGGLVASTRYWLYATLTTGAITFVINTTAPDAGLRYASGSTDLLYVSTFITNTSPSVLRYTQSDNNFVYFDGTPAGGGVLNTLFIDTSAAVGTTTVPYGNLVPTGASLAKLSVQMTGGAGPLSANIAGTGIGNFVTLTLTAGVLSSYIEVSTILGNTVDYTLSAGTGLLSVWCRGFIY